jgi:hypothetical protein
MSSEAIDNNVLRHHSLVLPVELCQYAVTNRLSTELCIYLHMKMQSDGHIALIKPYRESLMNRTGIRDVRTLNRKLKRLESLNWIGHKKDTALYFIRSLDTLQKMGFFSVRRSVVLNPENLKNPRAYFAAAVMGSLIKQQQVMRRKLEGCVRVRPFQSRASLPNVDYTCIGLNALAKILNCSKATAIRIKEECKQEGFIFVKHRFRPISNNGAHYKSYLKAHPELAGRIKPHKNKLWIQQLDEIQMSSDFFYKSRRKKKCKK